MALVQFVFPEGLKLFKVEHFLLQQQIAEFKASTGCDADSATDGLFVWHMPSRADWEPCWGNLSNVKRFSCANRCSFVFPSKGKLQSRPP